MSALSLEAQRFGQGKAILNLRWGEGQVGHPFTFMGSGWFTGAAASVWQPLPGIDDRPGFPDDHPRRGTPPRHR